MINTRFKPPSDRRSSGAESGFNRIDLVAVIAALGILAIALLPALASDRSSARSFQCMNNLRQLTTAWLAYSDDNDDKIVRTGGTSVLVTDPNDPTAQPGGTRSQWVLGTVSSPNQNPELIRKGLLFPYVQDLTAYKCPADESTHIRSVSMNAWMNPIGTEGLPSPSYRFFRKQTDISKPAGTWSITEEHPLSINDGWFIVRPDEPTRWTDFPATYHRGAGLISFADAHVEIKKWTDRLVLAPTGGGSRADTNSNDLAWLIERTTYP
jgi:type II secretory pathway pseudopilin PulG